VAWYPAWYPLVAESPVAEIFTSLRTSFKAVNCQSLEDVSAQIRASLTEDKERSHHYNSMKDKLRSAQRFADKSDPEMVEWCLKQAAAHATAAGEMDAFQAKAQKILQSKIDSILQTILQKAQKRAEEGDRELMEYELKKIKEWFDVGRNIGLDVHSKHPAAAASPQL